MFFIGLSVSIVKEINDHGSVQKFDYSESDSLLSSIIESDSKTKINDKKVDSEQELLDFSANDLDAKKGSENSLNGVKININEASVEQLIRLPGIGNKTANAILELRASIGRFSKPEDLLKVKGIGKTKLDRIKPLIIFEN